MKKIDLVEESWMKRELNYERWTKKCNEKDLVIASFHDYFTLAISDDYESLKSLQKDMDKSLIIASPVIDYNTNYLMKQSNIIYSYGSNIVKPKTRKTRVPSFNHKKLEKVLDSDAGLSFFQKLLNTKARKETIIGAMVRLSGKKVNEIYVWTPDLDIRKETSMNTVSFNYYCGQGLHIYCNTYLDHGFGRIRAVKGSVASKS